MAMLVYRRVDFLQMTAVYFAEHTRYAVTMVVSCKQSIDDVFCSSVKVFVWFGQLGSIFYRSDLGDMHLP